MCQVTVVGAIVILLYASRACYNLVVLGLSNKSINSFDYDWYNVSDQVNHQISISSILMIHRKQDILFCSDQSVRCNGIHPPTLFAQVPGSFVMKSESNRC